MKKHLSNLLNKIKVLNVNNIINSKLNHNRFQNGSLRFLNIGGKSTSNLLLSPTEASRILRTNESTVDVESKCPVKYYDVNYLGSNNPPEDRQAQAKFLYSDIYLFAVFDGHGGHYCSDTINQRLFDYIALNLLTTKQLEDKLKWKDLDSKSYPLWFAFQSPYSDMRSNRLKELHKQSLRLYAEDLLKEKVMEESIGNDPEINLERILTNSFLKLDKDILLEASPNVASGKVTDKETLDVAMSGSCACVSLLSGKNLYVANTGDAR